MSPAQKSFYLNLIYRGNDKTNFNHRLADRDLILMAGILPEHASVSTFLTQLLKHIDLSYNELGDASIEVFAGFLK